MRPAVGASKSWTAIARLLRSRNYRLTHSAFLLGLASFAGQLPLFVLAPLAGVWIDRWDRHRTLVWTQALLLVQSFALAIVALTDVVAARFGAPITVELSGGLCVLGALLFARELPRIRDQIRPTYLQLGILPVPDA